MLALALATWAQQLGLDVVSDQSCPVATIEDLLPHLEGSCVVLLVFSPHEPSLRHGLDRVCGP
jgi:hypothetical protein